MRRVLYAGIAVVVMSCAHAPPEARTPSAAVTVTSVEPPSWWLGSTIDPVRILVRGSGLTGARIEAEGGVVVSSSWVNPAGTALFADLSLAHASPGTRRLRIGNVDWAWQLAPPLERHGHFAGFSPDDVIYLLMPDRFANGDPANDDPPASKGLFDRKKGRFYHGGDFQGVIERLPYLRDLGVSAIWMTPIYDNSNRVNSHELHDGQPVTDFHGYGAVDYYGVEEHFGDLAKLRELSARAHQAGIKMIQDEVANHVGPDHPWANDPPTPDFLHGTPQRHLMIRYDMTPVTDPKADPAEKKKVLEGWFVDLLPDIAQESDEAARYEIQNTLWWIANGDFDGIRQDTLPYVPRAFWARWMTAIRREFPDVKVVGEMNHEDANLVSFFQGGKTRFDGVDSKIDTLFDFPLAHALRHVFASGKSMKEVAAILEKDALYTDPSVLVTFVGLHDMKRFMNEPGATTAGLALAQTFVFTARGTPMIYYGDEIGMPGGDDPDNRRDFPGGFPGDSRNAFTAAGRTAEEQSLFTRIRTVSALRRELEPLRRGKMVVLSVTDHTIAFARLPGVVVAFNAGDKHVDMTLDASAAGLAPHAVLTDRLRNTSDVEVDGADLRVHLPSRSAAVYVAR